MRSNIRRWHPMALALGAALAMGTGPVTKADDPHGASPAPLEGTWRVQVSTHDCTSGALLLSFPAMLTFARGGTMTGTTAAPVFKPGQRSPDHGVWRQIGRRQFRAVSEAFILFDSPPPPLPLVKGVQRITQSIQVDGGSQFSSDADVEFFDSAGTVVANLCATAVGTRFE